MQKVYNKRQEKYIHVILWIRLMLKFTQQCKDNLKVEYGHVQSWSRESAHIYTNTPRIRYYQYWGFLFTNIYSAVIVTRII